MVDVFVCAGHESTYCGFVAIICRKQRERQIPSLEHKKSSLIALCSGILVVVHLRLLVFVWCSHAFNMHQFTKLPSKD